MAKIKFRNQTKQYKENYFKRAKEVRERQDGEITNRAYANTEAFQQKCSDVGVKPTKRQASKFRRGMGLAYTSK